MSGRRSYNMLRQGWTQYIRKITAELGILLAVLILIQQGTAFTVKLFRFFIFLCIIIYWSTRWLSWSRQCVISRQVAGSVPDGVIGFFSLTYSFRLHYGSEVDPASDRNQYRGYLLVGKGGRCVGLTTLPLSCAGCLEILAASASWLPGWRNRHSNTGVRTLKGAIFSGPA